MRLAERSSGERMWPTTFAWLCLLTIVPRIIEIAARSTSARQFPIWISHHEFFVVGFSLFLMKKQRVHWTLPALVTLFAVGQLDLGSRLGDPLFVRDVLLGLGMSATIGATPSHLAATAMYLAVERPAARWSRGISFAAPASKAELTEALAARPASAPLITS